MANDLKNQVGQNKVLTQNISTLEAKNIELTRKYEDSKKNYFKVREEREKLKSEIGK